MRFEKLIRAAVVTAGMCLASTGMAADHYQHIFCGTLLDVENKQSLSDQHILIKNDTIVAMGDSVDAPADAEQIDLSSQVCMPGLMDMHVHIMFDSSKPQIRHFTETASELTLFGLRNLWSLLDQGFTTIRIPGDGGGDYSTIALRDAINRGEFRGPRMLVAATLHGPTGGHSDHNSIASDIHMPARRQIVDGADEARKAVRTEVKYGADWIKVLSTGGVMSMYDDPTVASYTQEEYDAFASEARRHKKKITAHAHADSGALGAINAGFDSIEHGTLLKPSTLKLMAKKGVVLVPTRYVLDWILESGKQVGIPANNLAKAQLVADTHLEVITNAYKYKVKMALGSDPIFPMHLAIREFDAMNKILDDEWYVLQMGTINSAELLGLEDQIGSLKVGKQADIVATPKSPIDDMKNIEQVSFVMKGGEIVRQ